LPATLELNVTPSSIAELSAQLATAGVSVGANSITDPAGGDGGLGGGGGGPSATNSGSTQ
jgi:hypothetical protein